MNKFSDFWSIVQRLIVEIKFELTFSRTCLKLSPTDYMRLNEKRNQIEFSCFDKVSISEVSLNYINFIPNFN